MFYTNIVGLETPNINMAAPRLKTLTIGGKSRTAQLGRSGKWWITPGEFPLVAQNEVLTLTDSDKNEFKVKLNYTQISHLAGINPAVIRLIPLSSLRLHEDYDPSNIDKVRTTQYWQDKPLLVGQIENVLILLDGSTRTGKLSTAYGNPDLVVPAQVVNPNDLELDTWLQPQDLLTIEEVWSDYVAQNKLVKPRQTRFGVSIGDDLVISVAEVQPVLTFQKPLLPPHPDIKLRS